MQDVPIMTIVLSSVDLPTILHLHASQNRSRTAAKKSGDGVRVRTKGHFISDAFWSWKIEADGGDKNLICNFTHRHTRIWIGNSRFALRRSKVDLASPLRQKKAVIVLQPLQDPQQFKIIISFSFPFQVRVWDVLTGEMVNTLIHHCEAVLHLRFYNGMMVTCSKDRSIAVWDMVSQLSGAGARL